MSEHKATVRWKLAADAEAFLKGRYSREHAWTFDGGLTVPASPSPGVVPAPWSNPADVDPEEAYVAAISSCHMLTFLYVAMRAGLRGRVLRGRRGGRDAQERARGHLGERGDLEPADRLRRRQAARPRRTWTTCTTWPTSSASSRNSVKTEIRLSPCRRRRSDSIT